MVLDWSPTAQEIKNEIPKDCSARGCNGSEDSWLHWVATPDQINVEGDALKFTASYAGDDFRRPSIFVKLNGERKFTVERSLMFPADLALIDWINIGAAPMTFKPLFDSGGLSFIHRNPDYLEYKIYYYLAEDYPKRHATSFSKSLHVPLGEWFDLDTEYLIDRKEGFCIHELDGDVIFEKHDMVTEPLENGYSGPYMPFRFYTDYVKEPQSMFYADLAIYGEGVKPEPPPLPPKLVCGWM